MPSTVILIILFARKMKRFRLTAFVLTFFSIWSISCAEENQKHESETYLLRFLTWERSATAGRNTIFLFDQTNADGEKTGMVKMTMPAHSFTQKEKELIQHLKDAYKDKRIVFISIQSAVPPGERLSIFPLRMNSRNTNFDSWEILNSINNEANKSVDPTR